MGSWPCNVCRKRKGKCRCGWSSRSKCTFAVRCLCKCPMPWLCLAIHHNSFSNHGNNSNSPIWLNHPLTDLKDIEWLMQCLRIREPMELFNPDQVDQICCSDLVDLVCQ